MWRSRARPIKAPKFERHRAQPSRQIALRKLLDQLFYLRAMSASPTHSDGTQALSYPFASLPAPGQTLEVAPGVRWIRMPLPYALDHINLWSLDDGQGWAIVDTGTKTEECASLWQDLMALAPHLGPATRVLVTHMHPDHVGMAGWLTRKFNIDLWMTRTEYLSCRVMVSDTGREAPPEGISFYRKAGWSEQAIEHYRLRFGSFGKHIHALPENFKRLNDGDRLQIGRHTWEVVVGSGHSPEHACLYCPELEVLISGDQVLPRISSNVSVYPTEPEADPMTDWLSSLDKLQKIVSPNTLVLPSHNEPFRGLHARLQTLRESQHACFERLRQACSQPRRAVDVFEALFGRDISQDKWQLLGMATGESVACLNHLMLRGELQRELGDDGAYWYRTRPHA